MYMYCALINFNIFFSLTDVSMEALNNFIDNNPNITEKGKIKIQIYYIVYS